KLAGSLQIKPTELLTRELTSTLIQYKIQINIGSSDIHLSFMAWLGCPLSNHIDVISSHRTVTHFKWSFCSNEIHLAKTNYKGIARPSHFRNLVPGRISKFIEAWVFRSLYNGTI